MIPYNLQLKPPLGTPLNRGHKLAGGLVGFWLMNEGVSDEVFDLSGNENTGTLTNVIWSASKSGTATDHTADGSYIDIPNNDLFSFAGDKPFSLFIRFNMTSNDGNSNLNWLLAKDGFTSPWKREWGFAVSSGVLNFSCKELDSAASIGKKGGSINTGIWYDAFATYDGSKSRTGLKIYLDGVRVDDTDSGSATYLGMTAGPRDVTIGNWYHGTDRTEYDWNGLIEFAGIYNREVPASEIVEIYREPFCMFKDPAEIALLGAYVEEEPPVGTILPQITTAYIKVSA